MESLVRYIAQLVGIGSAGAAWAVAAGGFLLMAVGLWGLLWLLSRLDTQRGSGAMPRLHPTLAEDMLDPDLGDLYQRSLRLDMHLQELQKAAAPLNSDDNAQIVLVQDTGSALGRSVRQLLIQIQAQRFDRYDQAIVPDLDDVRGIDKAFSPELLETLEQVLDDALEFEQLSPQVRGLLEKSTRRVDQARRESHVDNRVKNKSVD